MEVKGTRNSIIRNSFVRCMIARFLLGMILTLALWLVIRLCGIELSLLTTTLEECGFSFADAFFNQVSVTFIVISVVTVFASATQMAYWEDVMQYELVKPRYWNFTSIAAYLFSSLFIGILMILLEDGFIYLNFLLSIFLICILTVKMMAAFFAREYILSDLEEEFRKVRNGRYEKEQIRHEYQEYKILLTQTTMQQIEDNQFDKVGENVKLLFRNEEYEDGEYLLNQMIRKDKAYLVSSIIKTGMFIDSNVYEIFEREAEFALKFDECNVKHSTSIMKSILDSMFLTLEHYSQYGSETREIGDYINLRIMNVADEKKRRERSEEYTPDTMMRHIVSASLRIEEQYFKYCFENNYTMAFYKSVEKFVKACNRTIDKLRTSSTENPSLIDDDYMAGIYSAIFNSCENIASMSEDLGDSQGDSLVKLMNKAEEMIKKVKAND